ncbi:MAG: hypothetical protein L0Z62_16545 [Gemmataceae bacterium]|nr:hypothetical protein [Gemmataceae bacterium]
MNANHLVTSGTVPPGTLVEPDEVYRILAQHQQEGTQGWVLQDVMRDLHLWAGKFRLRFKLEIPDVPLRLDRLRWNCLGHFNPSFNGFGLTNEIAIDLHHLVGRLTTGEWWQVLATLFHEQLHFWQQLHGKPSPPGPGNYHNAQYRAKALECGLVVSSRGVNEGYEPDGPFLTFLREEGVTVPQLPRVAARPAARIGSKLKKWVCACPKPFNIRVARADFRARCLHCGSDFMRA